MTKTFCDYCGKEIPTGEIVRLSMWEFGDNGFSLDLELHRECATRIRNMLRDVCKGDE